MDEDTESARSRLDIDWARTAAAALAAVSSAVLLSTLGAVGTIIGAAIGSIVASLGTALYAQGLARSRQSVVRAQESALHRMGVAQSEVLRAQRRGVSTSTAEAHLEHAEEVLAEGREELVGAGDPATDEQSGPGWKERLVSLPRKRIAAFAAGVFVLAVLTLTVFELVSGRSVSSFTGDDDRRTTFIGGGRDSGEQERDREQVPEQGPSEGTTPSEQPSGQEGEQEGEVPSETPAPTEATSPADSPDPAESPTVSPTTTPAPEPAAPTG